MSSLAGSCVLVVEDDALIGMDVELILEAAGCSVLGPCPSVAVALMAARDEGLDAAVLDMNVGGEMVFPVADALAESGIPFVVLSGHTRNMLPARHRERPFLTKPFDADELLDLLSAALEQAPHHPADS